MINLSLKIINEKQFERGLLEELRDRLNKVLTLVGNSPENKIRKLLIDSITSQPEWGSLRSGKLKADFGIPDTLNIDSLLNIWAQEFEIKHNKFKIYGKDVVGGITVSLIKENYSQVLSSAVSEIQSKGGTVFWLEWLLLAGNNVVVSDYSVIYNLNSLQRQYSRTGEALMKFKSGDSYKVDAAFAGTSDDNFITRALSNIQEDIVKIIYTEIENRF